MITVISKWHYKVTTSGGATFGRIDGDNTVGLQTMTADGRKLGRFPTLEEALKALIAPDRTNPREPGWPRPNVPDTDRLRSKALALHHRPAGNAHRRRKRAHRR